MASVFPIFENRIDPNCRCATLTHHRRPVAAKSWQLRPLQATMPPIVQLDPETRAVVRIFQSCVEAAHATQIPLRSLHLRLQQFGGGPFVIRAIWFRRANDDDAAAAFQANAAPATAAETRVIERIYATTGDAAAETGINIHAISRGLRQAGGAAFWVNRRFNGGVVRVWFESSPTRSVSERRHQSSRSAASHPARGIEPIQRRHHCCGGHIMGNTVVA
jgi:hypothetical protein